MQLGSKGSRLQSPLPALRDPVIITIITTFIYLHIISLILIFLHLQLFSQTIRRPPHPDSLITIHNLLIIGLKNPNPGHLRPLNPPHPEPQLEIRRPALHKLQTPLAVHVRLWTA